MRAQVAVAVCLLALASPTVSPAAGATPPRTAPRQDTTCQSRVTWRDLPQQPTFTPYTWPPELLDRVAARAAVQAEYPPELRAAGRSGVTLVWAFVDDCGRVRVTRVRAGSGVPALDSAALRAMASFRFSPALHGRFPTPVWIVLPVVFGNARVPAMGGGPFSDTLRVPAHPRTDRLLRFPAPPGFAGPTLRNESVIVGRLAERYAPFRAEGVRGTTTLSLRLDPAGRVTDAAVAHSSSYTELDDIALGVARGMVFFPAVDHHGRYSSVGTTVPIRFGDP